MNKMDKKKSLWFSILNITGQWVVKSNQCLSILHIGYFCICCDHCVLCICDIKVTPSMMYSCWVFLNHIFLWKCKENVSKCDAFSDDLSSHGAKIWKSVITSNMSNSVITSNMSNPVITSNTAVKTRYNVQNPLWWRIH